MLKKIKIDGNENIKLHGRMPKGVYPVPLFFNYSGVEINCDGSEAWIDIEVGNGFHEPWIAVEINGELMERRRLMQGDTTVCLFRSMTKGVVKNVRFYRELQAMEEDTDVFLTVKSLRTDGELYPVKERKLKLEFIGDSITSGEGTYGAVPDTDWLAMYMSASRDYAVLTGKALDADVRIFSQGGWGVYVGWDNNLLHNIPSVYKPVCGLCKGGRNEELGAFQPNDFEAWKPDAIIVNLGTNDNSSFSQPAFDVPGIGPSKMRLTEDGEYLPEDIAKVEKAIYDFLKELRELNPSSHIVWAYGMLGCKMDPVISGAMDRYSKDFNDTNLTMLKLPEVREETYGAHMHPGYANHVEAAGTVADYLKKHFNL